MADYKPQTAAERFALQRSNRAAEVVKAVYEAQQKGNEETKNAQERFYNNLALFSSGTAALSVTYVGYLKNLSKPTPSQHPHWVIACWVCLLLCLVCSLFFLLLYSRYIFYFHEWQTANALKTQCETDATEFSILARHSMSVQTGGGRSAAEIQAFDVSVSLESRTVQS